MQPTTFRRIVLVCLIFPAYLVNLGCTETPHHRLASLNPWWRKQWEEDEKYARTYYQKLEEIETLARDAAARSVAEQEQLARQLAERAKTDSNVLLRLASVRALGAIPSPGAGAALQMALQDEEMDIRIAACKALGRRKDTLAAESLAQSLAQDPEMDVRLAAAQELGGFKNHPTAIRALGEMLDDRNPAMQFRAVQSLKSATGRDVGDSIVAWKQFMQQGDALQPYEPSLAERLKNLF